MKNNLYLILFLVASLNAQTLKDDLSNILNNNPKIQEKLKNYTLIKYDLEASKSGYYPKIDLTLGIGFEKTKKTDQANALPDKETNFNVYQNSLKLTQNLFNGFATTNIIKQQEYKLLSASYDYLQTVNDTAFTLANSYIEVLRNKELIENSKKNVDITDDILQKVKKLYDSGLTTLSEVNKVESSLALAKSNFVVAQNTFENTKINLEKILGRKVDIKALIVPNIDITLPPSLQEAILFALKHNPSILISNYNIKLSQASYKTKKSIYYPSIDLEISQTFSKNLSATEGKTDALKAMLYLKYNLFNGYSDKLNFQKAITDIQKEFANNISLKRDLVEKISLAWVSLEKLQEQLIHLKRYEEFSIKTLELYTREYDLGRRSLLDLLSAQNDLIGAKSQIINANYNILIAKYKILDALGILVPTLINKNPLDSLKNLKKEKLVFKLDKDNDLIPDNIDICDNSLKSTMKDRYGCSFYDENLTQIERYNGFTFYDKNETLDINSTQRVKLLMLQLAPYGFKNIKFDIYSNADYKDLNQTTLQKLSDKRAKTVRKILKKAGVLNKNINIYSNANKAPIFINDPQKNNELYIVVKKLRKDEDIK